MSENRILIASLLKPINDTRMYEKLGLSLCKLPDTQIHIAGFHATVPPGAPLNLHFHSLFRFGRLSWQRLQARTQYAQLLEQLQPDLVIACTHELLLPSLRYCRQHYARLIYDVQENYALNLTAQRNYPPLLRQLLAYYVRRAEIKAAQGVAHFLLAEHSYAEELHFLPEGRYTVVANKYKPAVGYTLPVTPVRLNQQPLRLLYSGTIAKLYGVFEAVQLAEALHAIEASTTLTIIGYSARPDMLQQLKQRIQGKDFIRLIGGSKLVPHFQILEAIQQSNIGLLPYQPNPSTFRCIPTKMYEYMAHALPMLVQHNTLWENIIKGAKAGISIDFAEMRPVELLQRIRQQDFYTNGIPPDIYWATEEVKLLQLVKATLKH
ncbi:MAG: glycosyltransferase [Pontibacter sp.]|nr:glycosyltransferase [Pontibacter sp.]